MPEIRLPAVREGVFAVAPRASGGALAALRAFGTAVRTYAPIEVRRNRVLYAGWPLVILGTVPFAAAIAYGMEIPVRQAIGGALAAWAVAGLPLTAVLFGAVAGAGLRGPAEDAEAALPVSARQRAFGALASAAGAFGSNALLVAVLAAVVGRDIQSFLVGDFGAYLVGSLLLASTSAAWLLTASFAAAFAASHSVLGAVSALIGGSLLLLPVGAGAALLAHHAPQLAPSFLVAALASTTASAGAAALALGWSAPVAARAGRVSWPGLALMCLLPLSGSLGSWAALWRSAHAVKARLEPVWSSFDHKDSGPQARETRRAGMLTGVGGRLVLDGPGGRVPLLPGSAPTLGELVKGDYDRFDRVANAFRDKDGRVWAEVFSARQDGQATTRTIWTGTGDGPLTRLVTLPPGMELRVHDGRAVVDPEMYSYQPDNFVPLDPAKPPVLKRQ